jgi:hypothetical protein
MRDEKGKTMKIEIEIPDKEFALIESLMDENQSSEGNSHGPLDLFVLIEMLLEDVALTVSRPGSWEGSNMIQVLTSHGYTA